MKFIIGLVGSGKTTLYRQLNESGKANSIELEYPPSIRQDEQFKVAAFDLCYNNKNIDTIIAHPLYLPKDFFKRISKQDTIEILRVDFLERLKRIRNRTNELNVNQVIFDEQFYVKEECMLKAFEEKLNKWIK